MRAAHPPATGTVRSGHEERPSESENESENDGRHDYREAMGFGAVSGLAEATFLLGASSEIGSAFLRLRISLFKAKENGIHKRERKRKKRKKERAKLIKKKRKS